MIAAPPQEGPIHDPETVGQAVDLLLDGREADLFRWLDGGVPRQRYAAGLVLLNSEVARYVPRLVRLFLDPSPPVQGLAANAVAANPEAAWTTVAALAADGEPGAIRQLEIYGTQGREAALRALRHARPEARAAALLTLREIPAYRAATYDPSPLVFGTAAGALAAKGGEERKYVFTHPRVEVRREALKRVQKGTGSDLGLYIAAARDADPWVRVLALPELRAYAYDWGHSPDTPRAIAAVHRGLTDQHPAVRKAAVLAVLGWYDPPGADPAVWPPKLAKNAWAGVASASGRNALAEVMEERGTSEQWLEDREYRCAMLLARARDRRGFLRARKAYGLSPSEAIHVAGAFDAAESREWLFQLLESGDTAQATGIVGEAVIALSRHSRGDAYPRLVALLQDQRRHSEVREGIASSLWRFGDPRTVTVLSQIVGSANEGTSLKCVALSGLSNIQTDAARKAVQSALSDPHPDVRQTARVCLDQMKRQPPGS